MWSLPTFSQSDFIRPNFIIIFTDDQTYRAIGYNNQEVHIPELDVLAKKGIIFDKAFTATPVCAASRASILTGTYPQTNGTVALDRNSFIQNIVKENKYQTMAHFLQNAGYDTYFSGKSLLGDPGVRTNPLIPKSQGFPKGLSVGDRFFAMIPIAAVIEFPEG